jgi:type IV secretory pathway VirB4 component
MDASHVLNLGRVDFRNDRRAFGIKHEDRFSHLYVIGKTGTGKSTLVETMALQDLERGNGFNFGNRSPSRSEMTPSAPSY